MLPSNEQLSRQIAAMITLGALAPGTQLPPSIRQLATDLDVAAGTIARSYLGSSSTTDSLRSVNAVARP